MLEKSVAIAIEVISQISAAGLVKTAAISLMFLYLLFAFAVWRQVRLMESVVEVGDTTKFNIISIAHLFTTVVVLILAFILL